MGNGLGVGRFLDDAKSRAAFHDVCVYPEVPASLRVELDRAHELGRLGLIEHEQPRVADLGRRLERHGITQLIVRRHVGFFKDLDNIPHIGVRDIDMADKPGVRLYRLERTGREVLRDDEDCTVGIDIHVVLADSFGDVGRCGR